MIFLRYSDAHFWAILPANILKFECVEITKNNNAE